MIGQKLIEHNSRPYHHIGVVENLEFLQNKASMLNFLYYCVYQTSQFSYFCVYKMCQFSLGCQIFISNIDRFRETPTNTRNQQSVQNFKHRMDEIKFSEPSNVIRGAKLMTYQFLPKCPIKTIKTFN